MTFTVIYVDRIQFLRHMRDFFNVVYKIVAEEEEMSQEGGDSGGGEVEEGARTEGDDGDVIRRQLVTLSCVGVGFSNVSKGLCKLRHARRQN